MALFNHAAREVTLKLVYYGPGLSGKTTNLRQMHDHLPCREKGKLVSLRSEGDCTLFFDCVPLDEAEVRGMRPRVQVYTVPGQVFHETTRRLVLKGSDGVVFVADSRAEMLDANIDSLRGLRQNLLANGLEPTLPLVVQYNKRDLPTALPLAVLEAQLNPQRLPSLEAVALEGRGVEETLASLRSLVLAAIAKGSRASETPPLGSAAIRLPEGFPKAPAEAPTAPLTPPSVEPLARPARDGSPRPERQPVTSSAAPQPRGDGLSGDEWLYLLDGEQRGPLAFDDLVDLLLSSLPEDTRVWRPGMSGWTSARSVAAISEEMPTPLPFLAESSIGLDDDVPGFQSIPRVLRTVLIADEDAAFRRVLALPLAAQGFTIHEAADGAAAWQLAVQHRPWLILAEISMPELDGLEFCRRVRNHPLLSRRPVVFVSESDKYRERYRALQIGADDFLSKSMPIRELLIRLQLLMTRYTDLVPSDALGEGGAIEGQIEAFGAPALLQICNQGRLTGVLTATAADGERHVGVMGFRAGELVSAVVDDLAGPEAVYVFLRWEKGGFRFAPGDPGADEPLAPSLEHLLLEGCRRIDQTR